MGPNPSSDPGIGDRAEGGRIKPPASSRPIESRPRRPRKKTWPTLAALKISERNTGNWRDRYLSAENRNVSLEKSDY